MYEGSVVFDVATVRLYYIGLPHRTLMVPNVQFLTGLSLFLLFFPLSLRKIKGTQNIPFCEETLNFSEKCLKSAQNYVLKTIIMFYFFYYRGVCGKTTQVHSCDFTENWN